MGIMSSVDLQMPMPGLKEHDSFIRRSFPWPYYVPALCGAPRCKSLAPGLMGGQRHSQGLPEKGSQRDRFSSRQEKQSKS